MWSIVDFRVDACFGKESTILLYWTNWIVLLIKPSLCMVWSFKLWSVMYCERRRLVKWISSGRLIHVYSFSCSFNLFETFKWTTFCYYFKCPACKSSHKNFFKYDCDITSFIDEWNIFWRNINHSKELSRTFVYWIDIYDFWRVLQLQKIGILGHYKFDKLECLTWI